MIESSVLSTSPWNWDPLLCRDLNSFSCLETKVCGEQLSDFDYDEEGLSSLKLSSGSTSPIHSSTTSSDAGDIPRNMVLNSGYSSHLPNVDLFLPSSIFSDDSASDLLGFGQLDWNDDFLDNTPPDSSLSNDSISDTAPSIAVETSRIKLPDPFSAAKSWSRMSSKEQLETVEALTRVISHQMGLREQLEVIRIIDPTAVVSLTDKEFVIDLACLNDNKLQQIRDYVCRHTLDLSSLRRSTGIPSVGGTTASINPDCSASNTHFSDDMNLKPKFCKKEAKERRNQLRALNKRQRKEYRQFLKERKSGLFVREEVMSLSTPIPLEVEEDINILE